MQLCVFQVIFLKIPEPDKMQYSILLPSEYNKGIMATHIHLSLLVTISFFTMANYILQSSSLSLKIIIIMEEKVVLSFKEIILMQSPM